MVACLINDDDKEWVREAEAEEVVNYGLMEKLTCWLESSLLAGAVLHLAHRAFIVDVAVLAIDLSVLVLGLNLERTIGSLVAERIRSVVVVSVDLLKDRHGGRCGLCVLALALLVVVLLLGHGHGGQAKNDDLNLRKGRRR